MSDDKLREARLARLRALMAKTTSAGCTEAEAKSAAALLDKLLGEYEIDLTELDVQSQEVEKIEIECRHHPVQHTVYYIGEFADCKSWFSGNSILYLGLSVDVSISEYLTLLFWRAIDRETQDATFMNPTYSALNRAGKEEFRYSFHMGLAQRLGERLRELKSKRNWAQKTTGFDLVAAKSPLVQACFDALNLHLSVGRGREIKDAGAYNQGRAAGGRVAINPGVKGGGSPVGRIK